MDILPSPVSRRPRLAVIAKASIEETTKRTRQQSSVVRLASSADETKPQHVRRGETGTQERQGRGAGTATGTRDPLAYGSVVGRQPTDPLLGFPPLRVPKLARPQPELPSFLPACLPACSPALDLDAGPPPIGLAPTISAQPPSPQAFLLPPVVAAYIYIFPLTSSLPSASHINPRPPPHFCTHHPSCPPPPARGSKTPTRRRSSLPCLPTRRRKKRSKYGRHPLSNCVAPLYPVANCHRFHYAIAVLAFDFYPSRR